jgi:2-phospho-L-lactate guanylyltransferase
MPGDQATVTAIVPLKPWSLSKTRLNLDMHSTRTLARAFSLDVIAALIASSRIDRLVLVSAEGELGSLARRPDVTVLTDRPLLSNDGLNLAVEQGRRWALAHRPSAPVVVVPADLPALTPEIVNATLSLLSTASTAFVPDAHAQGTTFVWAETPTSLTSAYGARSALRHSRTGLASMPGVDPRARWDVDTAADLAEARHLGVGFHTQEALHNLSRVVARGWCN